MYKYDPLYRFKYDPSTASTYTYDALGNLLTNGFYAATNAATPARIVVYAYDALNRLVRCDDGVAVNTVVYDDAARTRMVTADYGDGNALTSVYRYDPVAREMACDFGGVTNVYRYDSDGRLTAVSIPGEGWATYSYNALGQNNAVTLPGGTRRALGYDAFGRLASQTALDGGGNALLVQAYARSLTGLLETKATDAGTWEYGYDLTDQVTNAVLSASASDGAWGYAYDAMGNRKTASELSASSGTSELSLYAANRLNQYSNITYQSNSLQPNSLFPSYDLNGNMTWDGTNAYFWDVQNQLVLFSNSQFQVSNSYDAMGRRVRKEVSRRDAETQSWNVERTHHFFYDGWNLVRETVQLNSLTPPNSLTNCYTWGNDLSGSLQGAGGVGGLLAVTTVNGEPGTSPTVSTYYPLYDHNGNVERYIARNGVTVATFQYDAFGNTVSETVNGEPGTLNLHFRFSTKYWDAEAGLYYYGYRFYVSRVGQWSSRDPVGEKGGENLYGFLWNNPVFLYDISGLAPQLCGIEANGTPIYCPFPPDPSWGHGGSHVLPPPGPVAPGTPGVYRCCRKIEDDSCVAQAGNICGFRHCFIRTSSKEAGMGPEGGSVELMPSCPCGKKTAIIDHSGQASKPGVECTRILSIDEDCVNRELSIGRPLGRWTPNNQCNSFVDGVIRKCSR